MNPVNCRVAMSCMGEHGTHVETIRNHRCMSVSPAEPPLRQVILADSKAVPQCTSRSQPLARKLRTSLTQPSHSHQKRQTCRVSQAEIVRLILHKERFIVFVDRSTQCFQGDFQGFTQVGACSRGSLTALTFLPVSCDWEVLG